MTRKLSVACAGRQFHRWCALIAVSCATLPFVQPAYTAPPQVVHTLPQHGDVDVDPAITEIVVEFDSIMSPDSYSWVGGGESFPATPAAPFYRTDRIAVLPVKLAPDHLYQLSVNSSSHAGFRSAAGEAALPQPIWFRTGPARNDQGDKPGNAPDDIPGDVPGDAPRPKIDETKLKEAAESFDALRKAIDQRYSYRDVRHIGWNTLFADYQQRLTNAVAPFTFAAVAGRMLAAANDPHISVQHDGLQFPVLLNRPAANANRQTLQRAVPNFQQINNALFTGRFEQGVGYIAINTWAADQKEILEKGIDILRDMRDAPALIIDVRFNNGGDETIAARFAGCFISEPVIYAGHRWRDADAPDGFSQISWRTLNPTENAPHFSNPVYVLMGPRCMSSCEAFLLMMKQSPNATLLGSTSYGSSGNPKPIELPNGVVVGLPAWQALRPDGTCFENEGIAPDVLIHADADAFLAADPVLERALDLARSPRKNAEQ